MQNERAIRNSLEATKVLKQKDTILGLAVDQSSEKTLWMSSIVRDELSRPLVVSDSELHKVQSEDERTKRRLRKYSQQQVENVKKLAETIQHRKSRFEAGEEIRRTQLSQLREVKERLDRNLVEIENRTPYINVKHVVAKIY